MTDKEFIDHLKQIQPELEKLINRTLPVKIGAKAKSIFQENFRKGGFQDGGLQAWQVTRRQLLGKGADAGRGPLLSSRQVLYKTNNIAVPAGEAISLPSPCCSSGGRAARRFAFRQVPPASRWR